MFKFSKAVQQQMIWGEVVDFIAAYLRFLCGRKSEKLLKTTHIC